MPTTWGQRDIITTNRGQREGTFASYLLQESLSFLLLEDGYKIVLNTPLNIDRTQRDPI